MVNICNRLRPECILIDPIERDRKLIIGRMVERIAMINPLIDPNQLVQDILTRESLCSTDIGLGCAIPHAHCELLDTTLIAAARISPPLDTSEPDKTPVSLIFLLVGPESKATLHLKLLSKLARLLHDAVFRAQLNAVNDAKEFHQLVCLKEE
jgi:mannitol/fructose-specific phosphotransferase system IIA component (Ntr-type)